MADQKTFASGEVLTAEDVNTHLNPSTADHIPYAQAVGVVEITGNGTTAATASVPMPPGRFTVTPAVTPTPTTNSLFAAYIIANSSTESAVTIGVRHINAQSFDYPVSVTWHAIQMTPNSAEG